MKYLALFLATALTSCTAINKNSFYSISRSVEINLEGDSRDQLEEHLSKLYIYYPNEQLQIHPPANDNAGRFFIVKDESNSRIIGVDGFERTSDGTRISRDALRWLGSAYSAADGFEGWILTRNTNGVYQIVGIAISGGPMFK